MNNNSNNMFAFVIILKIPWQVCHDRTKDPVSLVQKVLDPKLIVHPSSQYEIRMQ